MHRILYRRSCAYWALFSPYYAIRVSTRTQFDKCPSPSSHNEKSKYHHSSNNHTNNHNYNSTKHRTNYNKASQTSSSSRSSGFQSATRSSNSSCGNGTSASSSSRNHNGGGGKGFASASAAAPAFALKSPFEDAMQRLFKAIGLRIDLSPVKRPLMEGSVWYDMGKVKVTLISGLCGNSREDVETRLRARAELLVAEFLSGRRDPLKSERDASSVTRLIQHEIGKTLPQLLNHLDIQLHVKFGLDSDVIGIQPSPLASSAAETKDEEQLEGFSATTDNNNKMHSVKDSMGAGSGRFRCTIYAREVWETQMEWTKMASVTQEDVSHLVKDFPSGNSLLIALKKAASAVEDVLLRKREDHYFESMREAELMLRHLPQSDCLSSFSPTAFLRPRELTSSVLQSSRGAALLLKVTLRDEKGNETACALPLAGGCYAVVGEKMHLSAQFQYSCIDTDADVEEVPLMAPSPSVGNSNVTVNAAASSSQARAATMAVAAANVQSSTLPPPQKALRLLAALLPSLWYFLSNLCQQEDLHEWEARKTAVPVSTGSGADALQSEAAAMWMMQFEMKRAFMSAAVVHAGSALHTEWWEAYRAARGWPASVPEWYYVHLCASSKTALDRAEEKLAGVLGWRSAPVLHLLHRASLITFAVSDSKKRVFALGTVFDSVDDFTSALSGGDEMTSGRRRKSPLDDANGGEGGEEEVLEELGHHTSPSGSAPACNMDIISVEETLRSLGVTAGEFDSATSTLVLTIGGKKEKDKDKEESAFEKGVSGQTQQGTRTLTFSQLNETAGITRLFRFCQKTAKKKVIYQTIRMDMAGSTYCRRAQRLLALVFRKGQFNKPGLRGKLLPIPVPFTSKFLVLPFNSILQREVFSMNLLAAMEPFCRTPADYPTFQWPLSPLPTPCFFNFWGPTKKLLQRLGPYHYCSISTSIPALRGAVSPGTTQDGARTAGTRSASNTVVETHEETGEKNASSSATVAGGDDHHLDHGGDSEVSSDGEPAFTLLLFSGHSFVGDEALGQQIPLRSCRSASELPMAVLLALDKLVCEQSRSTHSKKTQEERIQKILCDRGVPREITLSQPHYWPKVIRLLYDSQEYYVRHGNQYKLFLDLSPTIKTVELASMDVQEGVSDDSVWKNELATKYAESCLLPFLEPVALLYNRGLKLLEKIPPPSDAKVLKFFSINIRADVKQNNFHGSLSAGSSSFRKDTIQGLPSATPTAALESLLKEIEETDDAVLTALGQRVHTEITSGINGHSVSMASAAPNTTNNEGTVSGEGLGAASSSKLICSLEVSAAQKTLSPYLTDVQTVVKLKMDLKEVSHQYHWDSHKLVILGTPNVPDEPPVEIASRVCTWDEVPIVLPQLYARLTNKELSKHFRKSATELERAMTKGAVAMLEYEVRSRIVPVMGTEKLYQNIRVVQVQGESMWYAEIRLPKGLFKIHCVGEPFGASSTSPSPLSAVNPPAGASSPALIPPRGKRFEPDLESFHVSCSTNTKRGALRKILVEFYMLYVAGSDSKISLFGGRAPSTASAENNKKLPVTKVEKSKGGSESPGLGGGSPAFRGPGHFPAFMRLPNAGGHKMNANASAAADGSRRANSIPHSSTLSVQEKQEVPRPVVHSSSAGGPGAGRADANQRTHAPSRQTTPTTTSGTQGPRKVSAPGRATPNAGSEGSAGSTSGAAAPSPQPRKVNGNRQAGLVHQNRGQDVMAGANDNSGTDPARSLSQNTSSGSTMRGAQPRKASGIGSGNRPLRQEIQPANTNAASTSAANHESKDSPERSSVSLSSGTSSSDTAPKPRKVSRVVRSGGQVQELSGANALHPNLYAAMITLLEKELSLDDKKSSVCEVQLSHRHGAKLLLHHHNSPAGRQEPSGATHTQSTTLLSQSMWNTSMWPPRQLLHFIFSCVCREVGGEWSRTANMDEHTLGRHAKLRELCASLRPPNTVLTPTMPAKQFCVFFFHRYFGWQACDAEDVLHMNTTGSTVLPCGKQNANMVIIAEGESHTENERTTWVGHIKLTQLRPNTTEFLFFTVLASSSAVADQDDALNQAWEACMMHIITDFGFDHQTNIYQYSSLDDSVVRSLIIGSS